MNALKIIRDTEGAKGKIFPLDCGQGEIQLHTLNLIGEKIKEYNHEFMPNQ